MARTARSRATQIITREWVKSWGSPRISQIPLSGSCQRVAMGFSEMTCRPAAAMARDVGDLPLGDPAKAEQGRDAARADERKRRDEMVETRGRLRRAGKIGASSR